MLVECERWVRDCYILTQVLLIIATLLSHLGCGCSIIGHRGTKALCLPLALISASCPQLTPTARTTSGTWLYNCITATWFRCSSAYLHSCISWLTARSRVNMLHVQLLLCRVLPPGTFQNCSQHSCVVAVKLFLNPFSQRPCSASI